MKHPKTTKTLIAGASLILVGMLACHAAGIWFDDGRWHDTGNLFLPPLIVAIIGAGVASGVMEDATYG